jgi:hypothetical protein
VICEITVPEDAKLKSGKTREEVGQLEGRAYTSAGLTVWSLSGDTSDRAKVEWIVKGTPGSIVKLEAKHERAGTVRTAIVLE